MEIIMYFCFRFPMSLVLSLSLSLSLCLLLLNYIMRPVPLYMSTKAKKKKLFQQDIMKENGKT